MKKHAKLAVVALAPAILLLLILEFVAAGLTYRHLQVNHDPVTGEPYEYLMQIGRFPGTVATTSLNRQGFPDRDFLSVRKPEGCFHVLLLGDSFTFGDTVDGHRSWVSLLRRGISQALPGRCIELFNAGERASTIDRQLRHFMALRAFLEPDIVIVGQYQNDLTDLTQTDLQSLLGGDRGPEEARRDPKDASENEGAWRDVIRRRVPGSASVRFVAYHLFARNIQAGRSHDVLDRWSVLVGEADRELADSLKSTYEALFLMLLDELEEIPMAAIVFPGKMEVMAGRYPEGEFFIDLAKRHDVPYLDLMPVFLENRRPYAFQMYDGHLNEHGNALVAQEVLRWMMGRNSPVHGFGGFEPGPHGQLDLSGLEGIARRNLQ